MHSGTPEGRKGRMSIEIREVKTPADLKTFIYLPEKIHAGHKNWVHPLYMDDKKYLTRKRNKAFDYCDVVLFLARRGGEGRRSPARVRP